MTAESLRLQTETEEQFRELRSFLDANKYEYHTYSLKSEKPTKVVLKGLPLEIPEGTIREALTDRGYEVAQVSRLISRTSKKPLPIVLVAINKPSSGESPRIHNLKDLLHVVIKVESFRGSSDRQCHRCQLHGHSQSWCTAAPKCVKCGKGHLTQECQKDKNTEATCANCAGKHTASYKGCPARPKKMVVPARPKLTNAPAPLPKTNIWEKRRQEAAAASQTSPQQTPPPSQMMMNAVQWQQLLTALTQTVMTALAGTR
jgi:Associated with zinc fingers